MLFEVTKNNKVLSYTNDVSCIDDKETLSRMNKMGYKFKLNGKVIGLRDAIAFKEGVKMG